MTAPARRVVITDHNFGDLDIETQALAQAGARLDAHQCRSAAAVAAAVAGAAAVIVQMAPVDEAAVAALGEGGTLVRLGVGYDNVDVAACQRHGVALANVPDYGTEEVAIHALALMLALVRRLPQADAAVRAGTWDAVATCGALPGTASLTLGLVGTGRIGLALAARARPLGMRLIGHDPYADTAACAAHGVSLVSLEEVWDQADVISLHAPLNDATRHVVNAASLARMKPGVVLVNCARGELVDGSALAAALGSGHVAGAGLDVFEAEPLPAGHPLRAAPNLLLTPHAAWCSAQSMRRLRELAVAEIIRALRGEELRCRVA